MNKMLDQLFKVNPMLIIMCSITVLFLIAFLAGSLYLIAWLVVRKDRTETH